MVKTWHLVAAAPTLSHEGCWRQGVKGNRKVLARGDQTGQWVRGRDRRVAEGFLSAEPNSYGDRSAKS